MKATYKFIIAALAATLALASCTKETAEPGITDSATNGIRTIAVSFGHSTKTGLNPEDGLTPEFKEGDKILVAQVDGDAEPQICTVVPQGDIFVIETTLQGKLDAVYPHKAAVFDEDNENLITGVKVPEEQTGTFAEANICKATIPANSSNAEFENKVSILKFYVDMSITVYQLTIAAEEKDVVTVQPYLNANSAFVPALHNSTDDPQKRICYVAVNPGEYNDFTVSSQTGTQDTYDLGNVVKEFGDVTFAKGTIYNVFMPYYIKVLVGSDPTNGDIYQYWSYCNLGAFLPEEAGYYYSWGNTDGHWKNGVRDNNYSFDENTYNATPGAKLTSYIEPKAEHDAACAAWGGKWRIPTEEEYETLLNQDYVSREWQENILSTSTAGKLFTDKTKHQVFFPAASNIKYSAMFDYVKCSYWTSGYGEESSPSASFDKNNSDDKILAAGRLFGLSIRPIYDESITDEQPTALTINPYPNGGTF